MSLPESIRVGDEVKVRWKDHPNWENAIIEKYEINTPFHGVTMQTVTLFLLPPGMIMRRVILENEEIEKYMRMASK